MVDSNAGIANPRLQVRTLLVVGLHTVTDIGVV
jgi:hypothetical protein